MIQCCLRLVMLLLLSLAHVLPVAAAVQTFAKAHSHNDYDRPRPLEDALSSGALSVEADVYLLNGEIWVGHDPFSLRGRLVDLYLEPLARRISQLGSVYGDGKQFLLWVDLKDGRPQLRSQLHAALSKYTFVTRYEGPVGATRVFPGAVEVILTGDERSKTSYAREHIVRFASRDSNALGTRDTPADPNWQWYALPYSRYFNWRGVGNYPDSERRQLAALLKRVHDSGRKLRIYHSPESPVYWENAARKGLDLISTADLVGLTQVLARVPSPKERGARTSRSGPEGAPGWTGAGPEASTHPAEALRSD